MDTKLTGDIAVQYAVLEGLKRGYGVMLPVGDRLPYDLVYDVAGRLIRIQAKSAWKQKSAFMVDTRRSKTNRARYKKEAYKPTDFDFALLWHPEDQEFFIMPISDFLGAKMISLPAKSRRINYPNKSSAFRSLWSAIEEFGCK